MQITYKAIDSLIPYVKNSRTHSDSQVAQIAASIKEFGFTNPVLLDEHGGIVAGHGRVMAARKLKLDEVPTITLGWLTDTQRRAYVIADNKLALNAGWDDEMLRLEFKSLEELGFDLGLTGFSEDEISDLNLIDKEKDELLDDEKYTAKIKTPIYEPKGDKPSIEELYDDKKAMDFIVSIKESKLDEKEKQFLMAAASRHIVFDYAKIANFYAHSSIHIKEKQ
jgi:hypothetical protein